MMESVSGTLKSSLNCSFQTLSFCELYQERPHSVEVAYPKRTRIGADMIVQPATGQDKATHLDILSSRHMTK